MFVLSFGIYLLTLNIRLGFFVEFDKIWGIAFYWLFIINFPGLESEFDSEDFFFCYAGRTVKW